MAKGNQNNSALTSVTGSCVSWDFVSTPILEFASWSLFADVVKLLDVFLGLQL